MALRLDVKLLTGQQCSLETPASRTVWDFKIQIGQKMGVSPYQQKLSCQNGIHINLQDGAKLSEFGLKSGDTILLMVTNEETITVFLNNSKGQTRTYNVLPSDTVDRFRARVQQQEKIQKEQFWFTYEGRPLEDGHKLSDYNIAPHGTIFLNMRLRGGWDLVGGSA
ncbi:ubiquitin-like protein ISG15 [Rhineura floridana]|uniref:ubiquitin-like protein ISG15 n=1 Tax=Rhineura floridana TaxID=261503 RepID=UPI002AC844BE|nr:ubiquitin-like protein ISG15 [Rhineura floridana]